MVAAMIFILLLIMIIIIIIILIIIIITLVDANNPYSQERRVMGMVAAPVEQHSIVILKV